MLRTIAIAGVLAWVFPVHAQSIQVAPVTLDLPARQMASTITVANRGELATTIQIRPFAWSQSPMRDDLLPTDDLAVSPPAATLPPGEEQVVRVVLRRPAGQREAAFRILVDQLPLPQPDGTVQLTLRLSIPVFAGAPDPGEADLGWRVDVAESGHPHLVATNTGERHERVRAIRLTSPGRRPLAVRENVNPYVLAGVERRWQIEAARGVLDPGMRLELEAILDRGPLRQTVDVGAVP